MSNEPEEGTADAFRSSSSAAKRPVAPVRPQRPLPGKPVLKKEPGTTEAPQAPQRPANRPGAPTSPTRPVRPSAASTRLPGAAPGRPGPVNGAQKPVVTGSTPVVPPASVARPLSKPGPRPVSSTGRVAGPASSSLSGRSEAQRKVASLFEAEEAEDDVFSGVEEVVNRGFSGGSASAGVKSSAVTGAEEEKPRPEPKKQEVFRSAAVPEDSAVERKTAKASMSSSKSPIWEVLRGCGCLAMLAAIAFLGWTVYAAAGVPAAIVFALLQGFFVAFISRDGGSPVSRWWTGVVAMVVAAVVVAMGVLHVRLASELDGLPAVLMSAGEGIASLWGGSGLGALLAGYGLLMAGMGVVLRRWHNSQYLSGQRHDTQVDGNAAVYFVPTRASRGSRR